MYNIAVLYPNNLNIKHKYSTYRIIQYKNYEEGIAAISLFGNLLDVLIIFEKCSFLKASEIKYLINKQFPKLPILTLNKPSLFNELISTDFFHLLKTN